MLSFVMSKHSVSPIRLTAEKSSSKRRVDLLMSKSGRSSDPYDESEPELLALNPLTYVSQPPSMVGPASSVKGGDLVKWKNDYLLSSSAVLRVPDSMGRPEEIFIYEAFFESGFREDIPSLITDLCDFFRISPSQLNPLAWRILIAIQNSSHEECLPLGVDEVLFAYHLAPINGGEGRFHLWPRSGLPIIEEFPKNDRKGLWDLAREFDRFKAMALAEENFKGVDPPSFEDEPAIPPSSGSGGS
ncbi:unnamed protein product [Eruca vesicaria subsp. sativa]|uniref:Uncharacterized protein n=1 Tax=Eruca vesicaria subsp. sativa TaxID=29727 RepID=A0ABC8JJQ5_ERUVS|nr:unnamed protein product [Eruca vesicaria subsp. sativa]